MQVADVLNLVPNNGDVNVIQLPTEKEYKDFVGNLKEHFHETETTLEIATLARLAAYLEVVDHHNKLDIDIPSFYLEYKDIFMVITTVNSIGVEPDENIGFYNTFINSFKEVTGVENLRVIFVEAGE